MKQFRLLDPGYPAHRAIIGGARVIQGKYPLLVQTPPTGWRTPTNRPMIEGPYSVNTEVLARVQIEFPHRTFLRVVQQDFNQFRAHVDHPVLMASFYLDGVPWNRFFVSPADNYIGQLQYVINHYFKWEGIVSLLHGLVYN